MSKNSSKTTKRIFGFYWQEARRYPKFLIGLGLSLPVTILFNQYLPPLILANVIDRLSRGDYIQGDIIGSFGTDIALYAAIVLTSSIILWRIVDFSIWILEGKVLRNLAEKVFAHLIAQSADFHANNFSGSLVSKTNKLLSSYIRIQDTTVFGVIPLALSVLFASIILLPRAPYFVAALITFTAMYVLMSFKVSAPVRKVGADHAAAESNQTGKLADAITNAMAIKSFSSDVFEQSNFANTAFKTQKQHKRVMIAHQKQMVYFAATNGFITAISFILAILSVVSFGANIATVFLIISYTSSIVQQLFQFSNAHIRSYNRSIGDARDMVKILDTPADVADPEAPEELKISRGDIVFDKVTFTHKDADKAIFDSLNIHIKPGEKVGLVGHSGSGKTSLTRILLRFSDIQSGAIRIDGQNIAQITQNDLRSSIAYVPQEPLLFHRTIAENIGYGDNRASHKEIEWAAKRANAAEFIDLLPDGYQTVVGERGVKLSGGQRQRIAIARAMLKNAPILVLDEATSALDSESEALIQDALWKLMEGRTAIVIAHRLSTIQQMDRIMVLDAGKVIEQGTHKELLNQKGTYAKLWQRQSGGFLE